MSYTSYNIISNVMSKMTVLANNNRFDLMIKNLQEMLPHLHVHREGMMADGSYEKELFYSAYKFNTEEDTMGDLFYISDRWHAPYRVQFLIDLAEFGYTILSIKKIIG